MYKINILVLFSFLSLELVSQRDCGNETVFKGEGTYYNIALFGNFGNCSIENEKFQPFLIGAMNAKQYGMADYCGACVQITGPKGIVKVHIIDQCPECAFGDIDLSPEAFDYLAPRIDGRIPISWHVVPCQTSNSIQYYFKEGSSQYWTAVQVRNHRNPIAKFEYKNANNIFITVPRLDYNYFVQSSGMGVGPYTFRITDVYGNVVTDNGIQLQLKKEISGQGQFPTCALVGLDQFEWEEVPFSINEKRIIFEKEVEYTVYDCTGKIFLFGKASVGKELSLQSGFYILKSIDGSEAKTTKIIIE